MALGSYEEVRPWAKSIRRVVADRTMPPWHADPEHGTFSNDRSLSEYDRALVNKWVKQGASLGDPADLPSLEPVPEGWRFVTDPDRPTVRTAHKPYVRGENYRLIVDGFLLSPNVGVISVETSDLDFQFSDHNPVTVVVEAR